jgi:hypothetical protein
MPASRRCHVSGSLRPSVPAGCCHGPGSVRAASIADVGRVRVPERHGAGALGPHAIVRRPPLRGPSAPRRPAGQPRRAVRHSGALRRAASRERAIKRPPGLGQRDAQRAASTRAEQPARSVATRSLRPVARAHACRCASRATSQQTRISRRGRAAPTPALRPRIARAPPLACTTCALICVFAGVAGRRYRLPACAFPHAARRWHGWRARRAAQGRQREG